MEQCVTLKLCCSEQDSVVVHSVIFSYGSHKQYHDSTPPYSCSHRTATDSSLLDIDVQSGRVSASLRSTCSESDICMSSFLHNLTRDNCIFIEVIHSTQTVIAVSDYNLAYLGIPHQKNRRQLLSGLDLPVVLHHV